MKSKALFNLLIILLTTITQISPNKEQNERKFIALAPGFQIWISEDEIKNLPIMLNASEKCALDLAIFAHTSPTLTQQEDPDADTYLHSAMELYCSSHHTALFNAIKSLADAEKAYQLNREGHQERTNKTDAEFTVSSIKRKCSREPEQQ